MDKSTYRKHWLIGPILWKNTIFTMLCCDKVIITVNKTKKGANMKKNTNRRRGKGEGKIRTPPLLFRIWLMRSTFWSRLNTKKRLQILIKLFFHRSLCFVWGYKIFQNKTVKTSKREEKEKYLLTPSTVINIFNQENLNNKNIDLAQTQRAGRGKY